MVSDSEPSKAGNAQGLYFEKPLRASHRHSSFHFNSKMPPSQELKCVSKVNLGGWQSVAITIAICFLHTAAPRWRNVSKLAFFPLDYFFPESAQCHCREGQVAFSFPAVMLSTAQHLLVAVEA